MADSYATVGGLLTHTKASDRMSVFQRGESYVYDFVYRKQRYRGTFGPVSKAVAVAQERKLKVQVADGYYTPSVPPSRLTVGAFCERFLDWHEGQVRPHSHRVMTRALRLACETLGALTLEQITAEVMAHYQTGLLRRGLARSSVNTYSKALRRLLRIAGQWGVLPPSAVPQVFLVRQDEPFRKVISQDEERRWLMALPADLRPVVTFALHTGLRHTELLTLRWELIDLQAGVLTIQSDLAKSRRTRRVPLNETALAHRARIAHGWAGGAGVWLSGGALDGGPSPSACGAGPPHHAPELSAHLRHTRPRSGGGPAHPAGMAGASKPAHDPAVHAPEPGTRAAGHPVARPTPRRSPHTGA